MQHETRVPQCIGLIMDGNRRWAREKGLPTLEGHRRGYEKFKEVLDWAKEAGVHNLIFYALSTENWKRSKEEVSYLLDLFRTIIKEQTERLKEEKVRIIFAGDLSQFPTDLEEMMRTLMEETKNNTEYTVVIAASYGGRAEIIHAANECMKEGGEIREDMFKKHLWTATVPDPDIILRTGGEKRLSNFLPWQGTYSELFFSDTFWPDFSHEEFTSMLTEFASRERRMGK